jgi:hypothetical protein
MLHKDHDDDDEDDEEKKKGKYELWINLDWNKAEKSGDRETWEQPKEWRKNVLFLKAHTQAICHGIWLEPYGMNMTLASFHSQHVFQLTKQNEWERDFF